MVRQYIANVFFNFFMRGTYCFVFWAQHVGRNVTSVAQLVWDSKDSDTVYLVCQRQPARYLQKEKSQEINSSREFPLMKNSCMQNQDGNELSCGIDVMSYLWISLPKFKWSKKYKFSPNCVTIYHSYQSFTKMGQSTIISFFFFFFTI